MSVSREQVVQTAEKYVARGKIEPAIREYKKLLTENPNDINTLNRVGDLYARLQRIDDAVDFFNQIAEQYSIEGFFVKAIAIYKKIIKLDPTRLEVYERLADLYHQQGLVNEARTQYQVLADYYQKHANAASAIAIYQKMVELEPENPTYHVKLAEIYQHQQLTEKALGEYRMIAELMLTHGKVQEAAQVYERALAIDSTNLGFVANAVTALRRAGHAAAAARYLASAVERNPAARQVTSMVGEEAPPSPRVAPPPVAPPPAAAPRQPEAKAVEIDLAAEIQAAPALPEVELEPEPAALREDTFSGLIDAAVEAEEALGAPTASSAAAADTSEIELNLDEVFNLDIEDEESPSQVKPPPDMLGQAHKRPAWAQATDEAAPDFDLGLPSLDEAAFSLSASGEVPLPTPAEHSGIDRDLLERTVAEVQQITPEGRADRDEDLVSEAEVLAKYGLEDKAIDRLREALEIRPTNVAAHALLIQMSLDQGKRARVVELANQLAAVAAETGDVEVWPQVRGRLEAAGFWVEGDRVALEAPLGDLEAGPELLLLEPEILLEPVPELEPLLEPEPLSEPERKEESVAARRAKSAELDRVVEGLLAGPRAKRRPASAAPQPPPEPSPPPAPQPPAPEPSPAPPAAPPPAAPTAVFNPLEIGEMVEREEWDDDEWLRTPASPLAGVSPADLPEGFVVAEEQPASAGAGLDDSGMDWLDEADQGRTETTSDGLFEDEDDFFDLAAQLEEELSHEAPFVGDGPLVQAQEQSLEEIVEGFKKGVAEHLSPTDYDTHFNLGIAYREMGLLDEAIGEFQLAAKDDRYLLTSCSMLGLCFSEKGLPELAVKWYRRGLEAPDLSEEDNLGLLYDLGCAYLQMGDNETAYKTFVDVYGINTNYRDIVARIEELGPR